jgi:predicted acyl esterase
MHTFKKGHKIQIQIQSTWFLWLIWIRKLCRYIFYANQKILKKHTVFTMILIEFTVLKP